MSYNKFFNINENDYTKNSGFGKKSIISLIHLYLLNDNPYLQLITLLFNLFMSLP